MHIYDYIIIGSGLTGLTIAKKIHQETDNILVLEAQDFSGGENRAARLNNESINNGLRFFPNTDSSQKALIFLNDLLGSAAAIKSETACALENTIETFEAGAFKKFVGFGENPPEFYEQLSYFLSPQEASLSLPVHGWVHELATGLQEKIQKNSIVTRFGFDGLDSENPKLTHIIVNGSKQLFAHNFIFAGPTKELCLLVPDDILNARAKAKLKKSKTWQGVCLDLHHTSLVEKQNLFLLNGTTDDELGPCIGRFLPPTSADGQISQWMSFVDSEVAEETENIGLVLKKMKRQIRRAFPDLTDSVKKERIFVTHSLSGSDLKLNANGTLPKAPNLWVASSQMSPYPNLLGSLTQAQFILSALGFAPSLESAAVAGTFYTENPAH